MVRWSWVTYCFIWRNLKYVNNIYSLQYSWIWKLKERSVVLYDRNDVHTKGKVKKQFVVSDAPATGMLRYFLICPFVTRLSTNNPYWSIKNGVAHFCCYNLILSQTYIRLLDPFSYQEIIWLLQNISLMYYTQINLLILSLTNVVILKMLGV